MPQAPLLASSVPVEASARPEAMLVQPTAIG
jgi:hypothetical protein